MKKLLFQHLDERGERPAGHVLADALLLVAAVSLVAGRRRHGDRRCCCRTG